MTAIINYFSLMAYQLYSQVRGLLKATNFWKENRLILREIKYFRKIAILAVVFSLLAAILEGFGIAFILTLLKNLTEPNATPIHTGRAWFDIWILGVNGSLNERLYRVCGLILLTALLRSGANYLSTIYLEISQFNLAYQLRLRLFEQFQALTLGFFVKTRTGEIVNSLTGEVNQIANFFGTLSVFITRGSTLLVYLLSLFLLSWQLTLICVMLFTFLSAGLTALLSRIREASIERAKAASWYTSVALEFINGIRTVQAFAGQDFERKRFYGACQNVLKANSKAVSIRALSGPLSEGFSSVILVGMLVIAFAYLIPNGQLQSASLLTFLFVLFRLNPVVSQVNGARASISNFQGSLIKIKELLKTGNKPYLKDGTVKFTGLQNSIKFESVDFGYDPDHLVLHDITFSIVRGEMTALVGASGAGKSTLADLIPRFWDPSAGRIFIDGIDLREFEINTLRRRLAVVSQDTFIFNTSVRENIAYPLEHTSEEEIFEAAKQANAFEFIQTLPQGLDTQLGDRGVRLSGGQRQRIAIARALLRDPDILILDEATSALDSVSERLIQESLEQLSEGRTVIAIAHRLSTIAKANTVVVMEQGQIVEKGGYQELLERRGKLWEYHAMQYDPK